MSSAATEARQFAGVIMKKRSSLRRLTRPARTKVSVSHTGLNADLTESQATAIGQQLRELFSPIVEGAGLIGDYIKFFRQRATIRAIKKVHEIASQDGISLKPIAPRYLVPWTEGVSIEDPDSPLIDWWANLLVTKLLEESTRPYLLDVMSKIGPQEAQFLNELWTRFRTMCSASKLSVTDKDFARMLLVGKIKQLIDPLLIKARDLSPTSDEFVAVSNNIGGEMHTLSKIADDIGQPIELRVPISFGENGPGHVRGQKSKLLADAGATVDVCKGINLLRETIHFEPFPGLIGIQARYEISVLEFTDLGIEFMRACEPRGGA